MNAILKTINERFDAIERLLDVLEKKQEDHNLSVLAAQQQLIEIKQVLAMLQMLDGPNQPED